MNKTIENPMESKFRLMTEQLRLTNSDEDVANYIRWIIKSSLEVKEPSKSAEDFLKDKGIWIGMEIEPESLEYKKQSLESLLDEYAQQFQSNKPVVTDEEIQKIALEKYPVFIIEKWHNVKSRGTYKEDFNESSRNYYIEGIKLGLSLPTDRKEESDAVEFGRWLYRNCGEEHGIMSYDGVHYTMEELYELFTKSKRK